MAAHLGEAIGPDQISRTAGMSIRALQYAFRKAHGTTPGAFLKALRLEKVWSKQRIMAGTPKPLSGIVRRAIESRQHREDGGCRTSGRTNLN